MAWLLVFLAGCAFGSLVTTAAIAMCVAAKVRDETLDPQQQWRDDVRRLLMEAL